MGKRLLLKFYYCFIYTIADFILGNLFQVAIYLIVKHQLAETIYLKGSTIIKGPIVSTTEKSIQVKTLIGDLDKKRRLRKNLSSLNSRFDKVLLHQTEKKELEVTLGTCLM